MATALIAEPRAPYGAPLPPEDVLAELWASQRFPEAALVTIAGEPVRVLHPGLRGRGPGPDFRHARIAVGAGPVRLGDVELHVRATDFRAHGHHRDPAYSRVVLHAVFVDDIGADTLLASGERVPVVELGPPIAPAPARWREPCHDAIARLGRDGVIAHLDALGDDRFTNRVAELTSDILRYGPDEALGRALLAAALLSADRAFCAALADALPWLLLLSLDDALAAEALLLGVAGLLPPAGTSAAHPHEASLHDAWRELGVPSALAAPFVTLRPASHPARRLAGLARLLMRHRGLLQGEATAFEGPPRTLVAAWEAADEGYWRSFVAPGRPARKPPGALIGRGRAVELLVNAALPWQAARYELAGDEAGADAARAAYASLPAPERYGKLSFLEEHLRAGGKRLPLTARRQQGLLALYKRECTQGGCGRCVLS